MFEGPPKLGEEENARKARSTPVSTPLSEILGPVLQEGPDQPKLVKGFSRDLIS